MRAEEFLNFLEKEKLKSIIYKRLKWKEGYIPKSSEELNTLVCEFGKLKIIWWMPSVADYSKGKRFAKGQVAIALFFIGLSSCCLSKEYRLMSALCLVALSCYIICSFLLYARHIRDYVDIYKGGVMPFFSYMEAEECIEEDYIGSIKGIVNSAEFNMHVGYLLSMKDEGHKDNDGVYQAGFNDYASQLRSSNRFKTELEKSVIEKFLNYLELKRKDRKDFAQDIKSLRYCDERNDKKDIKEVYEKLFRYTKTLLWHMKPYKPQDEKPIDNFYKRVKHINGNLSLGQALNRLYILHDDPDQVLRELKGLLVVYHPDKNRHENAREIYEKVELIYKAVSAILKVHERHFGDTIFCNFKIFLGKKLKDIDENSVYGEIISTHKTLRMKEYLKKKEIIAEIRDEMLEQYRELIKLEDIVLEKRITYPDPRKYRGAQDEEEMKKEYEDQERTIKEIYKQKKEIIKELEDLSKKLIMQTEEISEVCSTIKERCNDEIGKQSSILVGAKKDAFNEYYSKKKMESFKKMLEKLDKEQKEMRTFLIRLKGKNFLNMAKNLDIKGLFSSSGSAIKSALNSSYKAVKKKEVLSTLKSGYETARNISFLATEYDYIECYSELCAKYLWMGKELKGYEVKSDKDGKLIFYKRELKEQEYYGSSSYSDVEENFNKVLESLRSENKDLNNKFKTQQELEKESKDNLLVTKGMKKKSIEIEKRVKELRSKNEISEKRAGEERRAREEAEVKAGEERRAKEEAEARAEEERRAKEEAEAKVEMERAEKKALDLLYDEADDQEISRKRIKQNKEVQKFLECQYTFLVLNEGYTIKFKSLYREYKDLKREMKEPDFEKLSELADEFEKLSRSFVEREKEEEESIENVPECKDQNIDKLKLSIVTRVVQARDLAEKEKRKVEKEKTEVEEIVKQLQMQSPSSAFNNVSHEPVAGPSWWI